MAGENVHGGHRERMRNRVLTGGTQTLADHELLEMLLYYIFPRGNTNETAHELLETYGDFAALMEADPQSLKGIKGMGESSAVFFSLLQELSLRGDRERRKEKPVLKEPDTVGRFAVNLLKSKKKEYFYLLCMDSKGTLLQACQIAEGTIDASTVYIRTLIEVALRFHAKNVVLVHNHPGGLLKPTFSDLDTTAEIVNALEVLDIQVWDHIIVAGNGYYSMAESGMLKKKSQEA